MAIAFADARHPYSQSAFGVNIAGEYSNGFNDCGFWLRGTEQPTPLNPDCSLWNDYASWNDTVKQGLKNYALASMDALVYPFFWTWKVSCVSSYCLGGTRGSIVSCFIWLTIGVTVLKLVPAPVPAYLFCAVSLISKITPIFFLSSLSPGFIFRHRHVLLAPRCWARCSGLCPGDSVLCITLQVAGLFFPQFIGTLGFQSIRDRANVGCFEVLPIFSPCRFFFVIFHDLRPEMTNTYLFFCIYHSSMIFDTRNYFRSSDHYIGSSCDHPFIVSPCHRTKLAF
jgi:hypothetical protein